ncbi:MAG: 4-(cytidine 5'-diphospho)-2-C-methyl-D-erythritol kinase [Tenericutes bacterium HGW-Tenericutes-6]|jgi:4-diphosphocytidyl-2-C-methyl-D-erythritol kinase|nr:MAG: 4-(cytidine 5'-diphospho)-2-C-methyl-D-erythritol kinase [Tenericutes bacterium HGW-Tenericutes-6]
MITEKAYAKLNLALDVVGKRSDGYHDLNMIMIPLELFDLLTFEKAKDISLSSNIFIENNAIIKAAELMKETFSIEEGVKIKLEKHIPIGAGLAGGSADIAATLRGLNRLWELNLPLEDLEELALKLGSDTLFCLHNQTAYVSKRGDEMLYINTPPIEHIYLFPQEVEVSTRKVFQHHKIAYKKRRFQMLLIHYLNENYDLFFKKTYNALLKTTLSCYPSLKKIYRSLKKIDKHVMMTGSGSTFYIIDFHKNIPNLDEKITNLGIVNIKTKPKI